MCAVLRSVCGRGLCCVMRSAIVVVHRLLCMEIDMMLLSVCGRLVYRTFSTGIQKKTDV